MFHKMSHLVVVFTSHYIATKLWFFQNCFPTERKQMNKELARYDSPVTQELPYRETANRPLFNEAFSSGKGKNQWVNMSDHVRQLERISHQMILTGRPQIANRKRVTSKAFRTKKLVNSQPAFLFKTIERTAFVLKTERTKKYYRVNRLKIKKKHHEPSGKHVTGKIFNN